MIEACDRLTRILADTPARLVRISEEAAALPPTPGRWCKKEMLGHLIDSAANNHQRFVRGQLAGRLEFPEYEQAGWVAAQGYASEPWPDLLNLWLLYNRHLLHVLKRMPESALTTVCVIGGGAPVPLVDILNGYVDHLQHHLGQILE